MTLKRSKSPPGEVVPIRRAVPRYVASPHTSLRDEQSAIVALVDELAILAADLWFAGKLYSFSEEEPDNDSDR